jgi:hypothetical protein
MRGKPGVVSVGKRHEVPSTEWGLKDWQAEEQAQRWARPAGAEPVVPAPLRTIPPGFRLHTKPSRSRGRGRQVDRLLKTLGIR